MTPRLAVALHAGQLAQPAPGGIGRYVRALIEHLPAAGIDVRAFGNHGPSTALSLRYELWHRLRFPPVLAPGDLVHAPSLAVPPAGRRPLVVTVNDLAFTRHPDAFTARGVAFHQRGFEIARHEAAALVTHSEAVARDLIAAGCDETRIHVVHLGTDRPPVVDEATVERLVAGTGVQRPFVLCAGTIEPRKGLDVAVGAVRSLRTEHPDLQLVVAGGPGWGRVDGLDEPFVRRLGHVNDGVLDALYRRATVFAYPSLDEGFGLPPLEAMARGCPVVASSAGSIPEVLGDAAALVTPGDIDALAAAIDGLLDPDELDAENGERARRAQAGIIRASQFTWEACAAGHRRVYAAVTGNGNGSGS